MAAACGWFAAVPPMIAPLRPADWILDLDEPLAAVSVSPDGTRAAAIGTEGNAFVVETAGGRLVHRFRAHEGGGFRLAWSPREDRFATSGQDGIVRIWNPADATVTESFPTGASWAEQLAWSPDGSWLAVGAGKSVSLWRPGKGVVHSLRDHRSTVAALAWRPDGTQVAAACYGGVALYEAETGRKAGALPWKTSLLSVAISPDHRWVVAGTQELSVQIWPIPFVEGEELAMSGYAAKVRDLCWHHGGRYLATGGGVEIMVWDCGGQGPAGTTPRILEGHTGRISSMAYQWKGHLLASGGQDGSVFFWNAGKSSQPLRQVRLASTVTSLAWTHDDRRVVAGTQAGQMVQATAPSP